MKNNQNNSNVTNFPPEVAPCGVYCGACPSFGKTCYGCFSERSQKRKSKLGCKLRKCCVSEKSFSCCFECDEFPCKEHRRKLINSHPGDRRFDYRHELEESGKVFQEIGLEGYLRYQNQKWRCSKCDGRIYWYHYKCSSCGADFEKKKSQA